MCPVQLLLQSGGCVPEDMQYVDPVYNGQGMNQPVSVSTECNDPIHMYPCNIRTTYNNIVIVENFVADLFCLFCG